MPDNTANYTPEEQKNIDLAKEYISISYDSQRASAEAVKHLCAPGNTFTAPTTFPNVHTLEKYAEDHAKLMKQVNDLHIVNFDVLFAKDDRVCLHYTAEGHHKGEPHGDIPPNGKKAQWTASALFRVENGKLAEFIKDWNKLSMWEQFGWPLEECRTQTNRSKS
ncbi:MAG: ester cyclase [Acidobacteriaceae bacterium]|nr:ester cyclase [Acidobacteriaceae bacterium]